MTSPIRHILTSSSLIVELPRYALSRLIRPRNDQILVAPIDLRTSDPTMAEDIYAGRFVLAQKSVDVGPHSPFEVTEASDVWIESLHTFSWLRHLRAADTALSQNNGRALVADWLEISGTLPEPAKQPRIVARRIISWITHSGLLMTNEDPTFNQKFLRSLNQQLNALEFRYRTLRNLDDRFLSALALVVGAVTLKSRIGTLRKALARFEREIQSQILDDGGHKSRSPEKNLQLLADLLPLRRILKARDIVPPDILLNTINKMLALVRMLRFKDGSLAAFHGPSETQTDLIASILSYEEATTEASVEVEQSGYHRIDHNGTTLICDTGRPLTGPTSTNATASTLAFELATGYQRIIVNAGLSRFADPEFDHELRSTDYQSTLTIEDLPSSTFSDRPSPLDKTKQYITFGPTEVSHEREILGDATMLAARHNGYENAQNAIHQRSLTLTHDGNILLGSDSLHRVKNNRKSGWNVTLRFHLHPAIQIEEEDNPSKLLLLCPGNEIWRFSAGSNEISLEESIHFGHAIRYRNTSQIVIERHVEPGREIQWSLERLPQ